MALRELALFAGAGGGLLGSILLGWRTVCAVEIASYCREVLLRRQIDGCLAPFGIWDDIRTFDGRPWRGYVDIVAGGFPCQDVAAPGTHRGLTGSRSSLWFEMSRVVGEVRPSYVFAENSPHLRTLGLGTVVNELASLGYDSRWGVLGARHVGAPHKQRNRIWITASDSDRVRLREQQGRECREGWTEEAEFALSIADTESLRLGERWKPDNIKRETWGPATWWAAEPDVVRVVHGLPHRVDRIRALGNAQIPAVAALAWEILGGE
jgi:DNA (cytosine-5)-methyltransferase 1